MIKYVVGFLFDLDYQRVVLIRKLRPEFLKGKLNGVGGKIEPGETGRQAVEREFIEEAGMRVSSFQNPGENWSYFWSDQGEGYCVDFYYASTRQLDVEARTDEQLEVVEVADLPGIHDQLAPNIDWLIQNIVELREQGKI